MMRFGVEMAEEHQHVPGGSMNNDDDDKTIRTGTFWTTIAHIITAVIGSGVLSLAWGTAQLGWIGGPIVLIVFGFVTYVSSYLLSDCYRSPDPVTGTRNRSFTDAVRVILGEKYAWTSGLLQYFSFFGTAIAYVVTTSSCVKAILRTNCIHKKGSDADCHNSGQIYMLLFGVVQIVMSQIPDFNSMVLVSVVAAIMSFCYSSIGIGLGFAKVIENGKIAGSITGIPAASVANRLWLTFQALGDIAFAYPYALVLLEIQDTIKSPPAENKVARKASAMAMIVTTSFYLGCGCFGYAAFGNDTPGNLLTGFGSYEPNWIVKFANVCIIIHLVGGYQLFSQPVFAFVERWLTSKFPASQFLKKFYKIKLPLVPVFHLNLFRLCFRSSYVAVTTAIASEFPYFNEILGVLGALNLWPLAIYFPVEMYIVQRNVQVWGKKWVFLQIFSCILMVVSFVALVGSVAGLIQAKMN
uniref:probable amino acid permease 7 n=1 Tax=Erigeron canadensis TaxID=72917 RepID=UPI001CB9CB9F|nr:probable amino acid permease 7 [Erigeron canadensis]